MPDRDRRPPTLSSTCDGHEHAQAYERDLAEIGTGTDRWLTELRLAVIGIIVSVALGVADIALSLSGWEIALTVGLGSALVFVALLWQLRPRARASSAPTLEDVRRIGQEIARIREKLDEPGGPLGELLERLQAELARLQADLEQLWSEHFVQTRSPETWKLLRSYDIEVSGLSAELRCRRSKGA